jgi:hypothetical protein
MFLARFYNRLTPEGWRLLYVLLALWIIGLVLFDLLFLN